MDAEPVQRFARKLLRLAHFRDVGELVVSEDRTTDGQAQVSAHLVLEAGDGLGFDQRQVEEGREHAIVCDGRKDALAPRPAPVAASGALTGLLGVGLDGDAPAAVGKTGHG